MTEQSTESQYVHVSASELYERIETGMTTEEDALVVQALVNELELLRAVIAYAVKVTGLAVDDYPTPSRLQ